MRQCPGGGDGSAGAVIKSGYFFKIPLRKIHHLPIPSKSMQDIVTSKKMENGIVVFWTEKDVKKNESFNYSELIDMKINALDLLERPKSYKVDTAAHKLIVKK